MFVSSIDLILYLISTSVPVASIDIKKLPLVPGAIFWSSSEVFSLDEVKLIFCISSLLSFTKKFHEAIGFLFSIFKFVILFLNNFKTQKIIINMTIKKM